MRKVARVTSPVSLHLDCDGVLLNKLQHQKRGSQSCVNWFMKTLNKGHSQSSLNHILRSASCAGRARAVGARDTYVGHNDIETGLTKLLSSSQATISRADDDLPDDNDDDSTAAHLQCLTCIFSATSDAQSPSDLGDTAPDVEECPKLGVLRSELFVAHKQVHRP